MKEISVEKILYNVMGFIFIFFGLFFVLNSMGGITGNVVSNDGGGINKGILGLIFFSLGIFLISKVRRRKKGQAAMEFLMTYGWAILAALFIIGILVMSGLLRPDTYFSPILTINPPFILNAGNVIVGTGVSIEIINNGDNVYVIDKVSVEPLDPSISCNLDDADKTISTGEMDTSVMSCSGLVAGNIFKGDLTITYTVEGGSTTLTSTGTINQIVI